jgi:hypothetical protein
MIPCAYSSLSQLTIHLVGATVEAQVMVETTTLKAIGGLDSPIRYKVCQALSHD